MAWSMTSEGDEYEEHGDVQRGRVEQFNRPAQRTQSELPRLPWTLFRDVDPEDSPLFCNEESFVPVCAEMPLDAVDEFDFIGRATDFANERLWGTLCATLTVPDGLRRSARGRNDLHAAISRLRYGTVCINQWPGVAFALLSLPWGGHPSSTLQNPQSGIGWTHNTFGLLSIEKTVLEGPLTVVPKPLWSPLHRHAEPIAWHLFNLYHQPSLRHVAELTYSAFASIFQ
jgi:acyl-CoA reductase-like NAD-dependent aldehyde dehydrogenase